MGNMKWSMTNRKICADHTPKLQTHADAQSSLGRTTTSCTLRRSYAGLALGRERDLNRNATCGCAIFPGLAVSTSWSNVLCYCYCCCLPVDRDDHQSEEQRADYLGLNVCGGTCGHGNSTLLKVCICRECGQHLAYLVCLLHMHTSPLPHSERLDDSLAALQSLPVLA